MNIEEICGDGDLKYDSNEEDLIIKPQCNDRTEEDSEPNYHTKLNHIADLQHLLDCILDL